MIPRDYVSQIIELNSGAPKYRENLEIIIRRAMADELCRAAAIIGENFRDYRINTPDQAGEICRRLAAEHISQT